jgi:hypothetical protein
MTPRKYKPRDIEFEAIKLTQYGDFVRARDWVNDGNVRTGSAHFMQSTDTLIIVFPDYTVNAVVGDVVVKAPSGSFLVLTGSEFEAAYELIPEAPQSDTVSATGHVSKPVDMKRTHSGGAALPIPRLPPR